MAIVSAIQSRTSQSRCNAGMLCTTSMIAPTKDKRSPSRASEKYWKGHGASQRQAGESRDMLDFVVGITGNRWRIRQPRNCQREGQREPEQGDPSILSHAYARKRNVSVKARAGRRAVLGRRWRIAGAVVGAPSGGTVGPFDVTPVFSSIWS